MRHEKAARLLELARRLAASAEGLTLDEMAAALQVSRRTVERMRDAVREAFPQMEEIADPPTVRFRIPSGLDGIFQATNPGNSPIDDGTSETGWRKFVFFLVLALGFGGLALWTHSWGSSGWPFTMGFGITAFVMAALSASKLVQALTGPKKNAG